MTYPVLRAGAAWLPWVEPFVRYGRRRLSWRGTVPRSLGAVAAALLDQMALTAAAAPEARGLRRTLIACLAITWLNPHV